MLSFGTTPDADVHATVALVDGVQVMQIRAPGHAFEVHLGLLGTHNVRNALAATACALAAGVHVPAIQEAWRHSRRSRAGCRSSTRRAAPW